MINIQSKGLGAIIGLIAAIELWRAYLNAYKSDKNDELSLWKIEERNLALQYMLPGRKFQLIRDIHDPNHRLQLVAAAGNHGLQYFENERHSVEHLILKELSNLTGSIQTFLDMSISKGYTSRYRQFLERCIISIYSINGALHEPDFFSLFGKALKPERIHEQETFHVRTFVDNLDGIEDKVKSLNSADILLEGFDTEMAVKTKELINIIQGTLASIHRQILVLSGEESELISTNGLTHASLS